VHIIVACPHCQSRFQIDPSFRGVQMRCPNQNCRKVFEAREVVESPPRPADGPAAPRGNKPQDTSRSRSSQTPQTPQWSGSVGDVVPILPAEAAGAADVPPAEVKPGNEAPSWRQGPPARRGPAPASPEEVLPVAEEVTPPAAPSDPADWRSAPPPSRAAGAEPTARGDWHQGPPRSPASAPPPRARQEPPRSRGASVPVGRPAQPPPRPQPTPPPSRRSVPPAEEVVAVTPEPPPSWEQAPPVRRPGAAGDGASAVAEVHPAPAASHRFRNCLAMVAIVVLVFFVLAGAGAMVFVTFRNSESTLAAAARKAYDEGRFPEAATTYHQLVKTFPTSAHAHEYQFFADLSDLRAQMASATSPPDVTLDQVNGFLKTYAGDPLLKDHASELAGPLVQWLEARANALPAPLFARARGTLGDVQKAVPQALTNDVVAGLDRKFEAAKQVVEKQDQRKAAVAEVQKLGDTPDPRNIKRIREIIAEQNRTQAGFDQDPDVQGALAKLYQGLFTSVRYVPGGAAPRGPRRGEDTAPSMVVEQLVQGTAPPRRESDPVVLALARGVLYALSRTNGEIVWTMRVGIDTTALPVRLPAAGGRPELVLALSADTETLTAVNAATGDQLWSYRLSAPCLGQPVIVGLRAYIPTYDGWVHEIELAKGQLLGHYELGEHQHLTVGGAHQPGTGLVYFPADDECVYVLDVNNKQCQGVLFSGHPSGSVRSAPIVVSQSDRPGETGYLILPQTDGLDAMSLRAFTLPIEGGQATPPVVQTEPTRGWPWFQPYHDPEKLALATDAGAVGLFGIRQARNQDPAVFPLVRDDGGASKGPGGAARPGRSQVVACRGDDLWVLVRGGLQKLSLAMDPAKGPRLAVDPAWQQPLALGTPLHASQVEAAGQGLKLFVVTQAANRRGCLATAVQADSRKVLWQRQLGLVCQGAPLPLGREVLALDQGGSAFAFNSADYPSHSDAQWQVGSQRQSLARPLDDNPDFPPSLHPAGDGVTAYEVACPGKGTRLVVRRFRVDDQGKHVPPQDQDEKAVDLPAPPAGDAAVRGTSLLLPLDDGTVFRLRLPDCTPAPPGPDWRSAHGSTGVRGWVAWLSDDVFLTTDGGHGLMLWRWPQDKNWVGLPQNREPRDPTAEVGSRVVAAPAVLPPDDKGDVRVAVADFSGTVTLLRGEGLEAVQHWDLGGKVTAGPFVRDGHVGCVVDGQRLVWLDPARAEPLWQYESPGEPIVGEPGPVEDLLVVAHQSGRFVGLDPATGHPFGPGFRLEASAAPAAGPVSFGAGRAFAPLTDGTVLLLFLHQLRDPFEQFPIVW
jgi:outer membrane protein assembly factor BamB